MENFLLKIIDYIFAGIISSGIVVYIFQRRIEHKYNKSLVRFSKIYSDKLVIIKKLYKLLVKSENSLNILMNQREPSDEKNKKKYRNNTFKVFDEFFDYFNENEIVFEADIVKIVNDICHKINEAKKSHHQATACENSRPSIAWENAVNNKNDKLITIVENEIPLLKNKLKSIFQNRYEILQK